MKDFDRNWNYALLALIGVLTMLEMGCKKPNHEPEPPTIVYGTVRDIDYNSYKTVKIGAQEWMAENLRTTRYRNGDSITNATSDTAWMKLKTAAYCNYDYKDPQIYGRFYNWYTLNDSRKIAPTGWHIPTDAEWDTLINFLGGDTQAGLKLQISGYGQYWWGNHGATNETGFTAVGTGFVGDTTGFLDGTIIGRWLYTHWWSSTEFNSTNAWCRNLNSDYNNNICRYRMLKGYGYSVRCVKD